MAKTPAKKGAVNSTKRKARSVKRKSVGVEPTTTGCDCCLNADPQREHVVICRNGTCTVLGIPTTTARRWLYVEDGVLGWGIP